MKEVLLYIWQLPQNLLGLALYKIYKGHEICTKEVYGNGIKCKLSPQMAGGITLGKYIIVNNPKHLYHELGHTKQSKRLGPLYLIVVGLPSLLHCAFHECEDYYHFYTEHLFFDK